MRVSTPEFTVVEYCQQYERGEITVNRDYQRSSEVWPFAAQSYLVETILLGFPIPKLTLYQRTDLRSRRTLKEIVDGQQRSMAIFEFFKDQLRLSPRSVFGARLLSQLDDDIQQRFLEYQLSVDLLINATDEEIRQLFRRINSYTVPLNPQEERHATYQGEFKWFIVELTEQYSQVLKELGIFTEQQLSRMADAALFSELVLAMRTGIQTGGKGALSRLYSDLDAEFPEADQFHQRFDAVIAQVLTWDALHRRPLMKPYNFYALFLAITHAQAPLDALQQVVERPTPIQLDGPRVIEGLSRLAAAVEEPERYPDLHEFWEAGSSATNTRRQRRTRLIWLSRAISGEPIG